MLEKEYEYYKKNKADLEATYKNEYIVIVGESVIGHYSDKHIALQETLKSYKEGTFLIKNCTAGDGNMMRYYSRVSVAK